MSKLKTYRAIVPQMIRREISERYRGSMLGLLWSLITPLILLAVYTFVFGTMFNARWSGSESTADFAIILFAGSVTVSTFRRCRNPRAEPCFRVMLILLKKSCFRLKRLSQ